jgi:GGDEF domain-containing protein
VSASIGIALYPDHGEDGKLLLRHADDAMYDAKRQGGDRALMSGAP